MCDFITRDSINNIKLKRAEQKPTQTYAILCYRQKVLQIFIQYDDNEINFVKNDQGYVGLSCNYMKITRDCVLI